jgi:NAD(P) transhydrogenase subunit alpha
MIIGVPKESVPGERRVALVPDAAGKLAKAGHEIRIERGAGTPASFTDDAYRAAGAKVEPGGPGFWAAADAVLRVQKLSPAEANLPREGAAVVAMLAPFANREVVETLARRKVTAFSLDLLPRITRAQPMDVLSSMSTVAGYKAVLLAAAATGRFFPMLVTAAGTVPPAKVLILGAGVAGLQAIATAKRLGAVVQAFDVRPAVKEQVESLGAQFIAAEVSPEGEGAGGYAKQLSEEQHRRELELIHRHIKEVDVVISTALIPGRPAPVLITEEMVHDMRSGAVIVDLAAEAGGNCVLTRAGEDVHSNGVTISGPLNLPATLPAHASQMFARNMSSFLTHITKDGKLNLDFSDEITRGTTVTHAGAVVNEAVKKAFGL